MASISLPRLALIELDTNKDTRLIWSYPVVDETEERLLLAKSGLQSGSLPTDQVEFTCGYFRDSYHYIFTRRMEVGSMPRVSGVCLVILTSSFRPHHFRRLGAALLDAYLVQGTPVVLVESLLRLATAGCFQLPNNDGMFTDKDSQDDVKTVLIEMTEKFGTEFILLYSAMVLKKRIFIIGESEQRKEDILDMAMSLTCLLPPQSSCPPVYSWIMSSDHADFSDMMDRPAYIAASSHTKALLRQDLYDILVNYDKGSITVAEHAKDLFTMGKFHKDFSHLIVETAEARCESTLIETIQRRTRETLDLLANIANESGGHITRETLSAKKLAPATVNFLFNLGLAQGISQ